MYVLSQLWKLEDFALKWTKGLEGSGTDPVALIVMGQISAYRKCLPYMKCVRGDGWDKRHWTQLFGKLNFRTKGPNAISLENLTLGHWLEKADLLVTHAEFIKNLDAQVCTEARHK